MQCTVQGFSCVNEVYSCVISREIYVDDCVGHGGTGLGGLLVEFHKLSVMELLTAVYLSNTT